MILYKKGLLAQAIHQGGHLLQTVQAGHDQVQGLLAVVAILGKQGLEGVV